MKKTDRQKILQEAERLERIAVDVEELKKHGGKFQADKLRNSAKVLRSLIHGGGTGDQ